MGRFLALNLFSFEPVRFGVHSSFSAQPVRIEPLNLSLPVVSKNLSVAFGSLRSGSVRFGRVRCGPIRFGSVRFGSVRLCRYNLILDCLILDS